MLSAMSFQTIDTTPLNKSSKVLITGGAGFIGRYLSNSLIEQGHSVTILDDLSTGRHENINPHATFILGDVTDPAAVDRAVEGADLIVHLASVVGMRLAAQVRQRAFDISKFGTENLLARSGNIPAILLSTSAVYGIHGGDRAASEAHAVDYEQLKVADGGNEGYACGKWQVERVGHEYMQDRPIMMVRPFNVVGPHQRGCYGMVVPRFIEAALANEPLMIFDDGLQTRSFTDVFIFVEAMIQLAQNPQSWLPDFNIINIGNEVSTGILTLARRIVEITRSESELLHVPYENIFPGRTDTRNRMPDCSHLYSLIGHVRWPDIDSVIHRIVASQKELAKA